MKRLLLFTSWYPTPENPHQYTFVSQQIHILKKYLPLITNEEWKVIVWNQTLHTDLPSILFKKKKQLNYNWEDNGIKILKRQGIILSHRLDINQETLYSGSMISTYKEIIQELNAPPDIVWTVTLSSAIQWHMFAESQNIKTPFFLQEHSVPLSMHLKQKYKLEIAKKLFNKLSSVIVVAERQKEEFINLNPEYSPIVIWNAADEAFIKASAEVKIESDKIIFVGRLSKQKGIIRMLNAFASLPNKHYKLYLIGDGEDKETVHHRIQELGLSEQVILLGTQKPQQIAKELASSSLFILPSFYENCPVALIEAQVIGVPSLITNNNASEKILLQNSGVAVTDDGMGEQLGEALSKILSELNTYNRAEIRKNALNSFSPEVFAKKMYEHCFKILYTLV